MVVKGTGTRARKPAPTASYINAVARMEVDEGLSVGNFLTDIGTRSNQEEPRSSIARLWADEHPRCGERYVRLRRRTPSCCNERAARLTTIIRVAVDKGFPVVDGVTDKSTRANQEEPRSSIARQRADEHPRRGEWYARLRRWNPGCCNESAARLTKTIRVAVGRGYSVGNGVTNKGTRTNQEEPRSSIAPLIADKHPCSRKRSTR